MGSGKKEPKPRLTTREWRGYEGKNPRIESKGKKKKKAGWDFFFFLRRIW